MRTLLMALCAAWMLGPEPAAPQTVVIHSAPPVASWPHSTTQAMDEWPAGDGIPVMSGSGGALLRASNGDLWVVNRATCRLPGDSFDDISVRRGVVSADGVVVRGNGTEDLVYCAPSVSPGEQTTSWNGIDTDGHDHLFGIVNESSHGWSSWTLVAMEGFGAQGLGSAESYVGSGLLGAGDGFVYAMWSFEGPPRRIMLGGFTNSGTEWTGVQVATNAVLGGFLGVDDAGNAVACWHDFGADSLNIRPFDHSGTPLWAGPARTVPSYALGMVPDGAGGIYVMIERSVSPAFVLRALHLDSNGQSHAGWPQSGIDPFPGRPPASAFDFASDGAGGVLVMQSTNPPHVQRLLADGTVAPGWAADGNAIAGPPAPYAIGLVADRAGGAWIVWSTDLNTAALRDIRYAHVLHDGTDLDSAGTRALTTATGAQTLTDLMADGVGGFFAAWDDSRSGIKTIYAGHVPAEVAPTTAAPGAPPITFTMAPSPASGFWRISWEAKSPVPVRLTVFDVTGRVQFVDERHAGTVGPQSWTVHAGTRLRPGVYLVQFEHDGRLERMRTVVVH